MSDGTEHVRISAGTTIVYFDGEGNRKATTVVAVHPDRELIEAFGVPGVLRLQDIAAVGVNGDEAIFDLVSDGTGDQRITRPDDGGSQ